MGVKCNTVIRGNFYLKKDMLFYLKKGIATKFFFSWNMDMCSLAFFFYLSQNHPKTGAVGRGRINKRKIIKCRKEFEFPKPVLWMRLDLLDTPSSPRLNKQTWHRWEISARSREGNEKRRAGMTRCNQDLAGSVEINRIRGQINGLTSRSAKAHSHINPFLFPFLATSWLLFLCGMS